MRNAASSDTRPFFTLNDIILFMLVLLVAVIIYVAAGTNTGGGYALVTVDGEAAATIDLTDPQSIGEHNIADSGIVLLVESGRIKFLHSPCNNQICVNSGWLSESGDIAACVPQRVAVEIIGEGGTDAVTY